MEKPYKLVEPKHLLLLGFLPRSRVEKVINAEIISLGYSQDDVNLLYAICGSKQTVIEGILDGTILDTYIAGLSKFRVCQDLVAKKGSPTGRYNLYRELRQERASDVVGDAIDEIVADETK